MHPGIELAKEIGYDAFEEIMIRCVRLKEIGEDPKKVIDEMIADHEKRYRAYMKKHQKLFSKPMQKPDLHEAVSKLINEYPD